MPLYSHIHRESSKTQAARDSAAGHCTPGSPGAFARLCCSGTGSLMKRTCPQCLGTCLVRPCAVRYSSSAAQSASGKRQLTLHSLRFSCSLSCPPAHQLHTFCPAPERHTAAPTALCTSSTALALQGAAGRLQVAEVLHKHLCDWEKIPISLCPWLCHHTSSDEGMMLLFRLTFDCAAPNTLSLAVQLKKQDLGKSHLKGTQPPKPTEPHQAGQLMSFAGRPEPLAEERQK